VWLGVVCGVTIGGAMRRWSRERRAANASAASAAIAIH
jgi:hypothetical protein